MLAAAAALAAFVATFAAIAGILNGRGQRVEARFADLARRRSGGVDTPFGQRVVSPLFSGVGRGFGGLLPGSLYESIDRNLDASGWPMSAGQFISLLVGVGMLLAAAPSALVLLANGSVSALTVIFGIILAVFGTMLLVVWMRRGIKARRLEVWRSLPDACDLLTLSVEAGLGLDAALRLVSQKLRGPLAEEVGRALREIGLGRPRREALEAVAERLQVPELDMFIGSLIQTDQLGTTLGGVLRSQSVTLRTQRRQRAQEMVRKAPVKMVFPLILFTVPSFFIVTIGPIAVRLVDYLND
jgi:tight adherence protein C